MDANLSLTDPLGSKEVVVQSSESLPGVVTPIRPTHEVFNDQSNVNEADAVVRGQVSLENQIMLTGNNPCQLTNKGRKTKGTKSTKQITKSFTLTSLHITGYERKLDYHIHLEVDPTEPWIFLLGKNTQCQ